MVPATTIPDESRFRPGDHVVVRAGPFEGYRGIVSALLADRTLVRVLISLFDQQTPVELEEGQLVRVSDAA